LPPPTCVRNDVTVGPPGSVLVVTGSNMSGKSTLLRAIGLNAVLARAGAPVCARSLSLPPLTVATCMRVEDSLADGTSLFMAELERLKRVVEAAAGEEPALILLDEILHGTNTAERQIAARTVLRTLATSRAIGAISTHDLELVDPPDLRDLSVPVHFTEEVSRAPDGAPTIHFDYRLRPGLATSTNALTLLEVVGLHPPEPGP
jgi:DNA mismatch repair ATPase MutS